MKIYSERVPPRLPRESSPPLIAQRRRSLQPQWLLTAGLVAVAGALLFWFEPGQYPGYPLCLFHKYTGLLCPGCGSLRAMHQLLHGHLLAALHFNALFVLGLPLLFIWAWRAFVRNPRAAALVLPGAWLWSGLVVAVLFGLLRNLPFAQHAWLAP